MTLGKSPIAQEKDTINKMIDIYCRKKHGTKQGLCSECRDLLDYAHLKLSRCKFGNEKPTCAA